MYYLIFVSLKFLILCFIFQFIVFFAIIEKFEFFDLINFLWSSTPIQVVVFFDKNRFLFHFLSSSVNYICLAFAS